MKQPALLGGWESIYAAGAEAAGGKGWQLAALARYGLPVPDMVVIPAGMERAWLDGGESPALEGDSTEPVDENALALYHRQLLARPLPAFLGPGLEKLLIEKGWLDRPLAVRSSATAEDSAAASFAGIHLTRLNLVGVKAVLEGIREVWASRWRPQAVAYRQRIGLDPAACSMAVLVMPLLPAEASGIAFTCDPRNGRDDRLLVHAHWGLGEALVAGEAAGDEILLEEDYLDNSLRLRSYTKGDKRVARQPCSGGTRLVETPPERVASRVFDDDQALALGALLRDAAIALDFSRPFFDLEWVWDGERFWLVQARPITALGRNTYPALRGQPEIWSRGNTCEVTPFPLSVYDWLGNRRLVNMMLERPLVMVGYHLLPGTQRAGLFDGRLYLNLSLLQWEYYDAFGFLPKAFNAMVGGHQPEITVSRATPGQRLIRLLRVLWLTLKAKRLRRHAEAIFAAAHRLAREWREAPLPSNEPDLVARLLELVRATRAQSSLFFLQSASGGSLTALADMLEARLPGESQALVSALLAGGEPSVTARQAYELADLAKMAREDPTARAWLADPRRDDDWRNALPQKNPFRVAFAGFLERYGHRAVYETYFRHPRWRESPGYLFDTLQGLMEQDMEALRKRQRRANLQAAERARYSVSWRLRPLMKGLIKSANEETNHREAARSALISLIEPQRRILLQIGRLWQAQGIIRKPEAVFEISLAELQRHADSPFSAEALAARLADRQRQLALWQSRPAVEVVLEHVDARFDAPDEPSLRTTETGAFQGMPVGTGKASGRVRILRSPIEGTRLQPGEVLAAPSTDPSWTPLFLKAGALIMETGGCLSHGAIVAREFGIPAVVNLPGILDRLQEGERVEVDGRLGRIRRLSDSGDDEREESCCLAKNGVGG